MLTGDLVRAAVRQGTVRPRYVDPEDAALLELARTLIETFRSHRGESLRALRRELELILGSGTEFKLHRGLAKLLEDRCEFDTRSPLEPVELRRAIFEESAREYARAGEAAGAGRLDRAGVLRRAAGRLEIEVEELERCLYADLKSEQRLESFDEIDPRHLLERYNVALAQAVLLRATALEVTISGQPARRYRELFRCVKFFQLLHTVEGDDGSGYRIRLDGPMSLFKSSQRYGLQMANFLPTLLGFDRWKLEAEVVWGKMGVKRGFSLTPRAGLKPYRHLRGQYQPPELEWFAQQFEKVQGDWRLSDGVDLVELAGQGVIVPDHVFVHAPTGRRVYMEIFGFWRKGAVASRVELLRRHGAPDFILAVSSDVRLEEEALDGLPVELYRFRSQPIARDVAKILEGYVAGGE